MTLTAALVRLIWVALALCTSAGAGFAQEGADALRLAQGQRIYQEGVLPSGQALVGVAQAGVTRRGRDAACLACHRRSGFGTTEGAFVVRPITHRDLHETTAAAGDARVDHWRGKRTRPAYDEKALAAAIREGVDVTGRPLKDVMPRYALGDSDMAALQAYMATLYAHDDAGITGDEIHLATVVEPGVSPSRRRAMLEVMEAFVREKNAGVRSEEARRSAGTMRMFRSYRKWTLHVWDLSGPPGTWAGQLEDAYRRQPVFALVGGLGSGSWQPVHDFSERHRVPCILPQTDLPGQGGQDFYSVYYSRGIALEADALARFLADERIEGPVVQVWRKDTRGAAAAQAFRSALNGGVDRLRDRALDAPPDAAFWRALAAQPGGTLVLWLESQDLVGAEALGTAERAKIVYLSGTLLGGDTVPAGLDTRLTYPWELPAERAGRVQRSTMWLRTRGLEPQSEEDRATATHALFAMTVAGEALMHLQDSFSRDYFVERAEHAITTSIMPTFFPRVSLGPGTRFASKGVYIVRPRHAPGPALEAVSQWIVP